MASLFNIDLKNLLDLSVDPVHGTINLYHLHGLLNGVILKLNRSSKSSEIHGNVDNNDEVSLFEANAKRSAKSNEPQLQVGTEVVTQPNVADVSKIGAELSEAKPQSGSDQLDEDFGNPVAVKNQADSPKIEISTSNLQNLNPETSSSANKEDKTIYKDDHSSPQIQNLDNVKGKFDFYFKICIKRY